MLTTKTCYLTEGIILSDVQKSDAEKPLKRTYRKRHYVKFWTFDVRYEEHK